MKKLLIILLLVTSLFSKSELKVYNDFYQAVNIAKSQNKQILMFLSTPFCPWCKKMKEQTLSDEKVINFINSNYIFLMLDRDNDNYPRSFYPRYIPTTYLINPNTLDEEYALYGFKTTTEFFEELQD